MYITTGKQYNELYNFAICFQCILTPNNSRVYIIIVNCVRLKYNLDKSSSYLQVLKDIMTCQFLLKLPTVRIPLVVESIKMQFVLHTVQKVAVTIVWGLLGYTEMPQVVYPHCPNCLSDPHYQTSHAFESSVIIHVYIGNGMLQNKLGMQYIPQSMYVLSALVLQYS